MELFCSGDTITPHITPQTPDDAAEALISDLWFVVGRIAGFGRKHPKALAMKSRFILEAVAKLVAALRKSEEVF